MAEAKQIEKELIEWYNAQDKSETDSYFEDYFEPTEYFETAWGEGEYSVYNYLYAFGSQKPVIEIPSGKVQIVEDIGGPDEGSTRFAILSVDDQFFKVEGYYASWDGDNWDNAKLVEVEPRDVVKVEYFPKEG